MCFNISNVLQKMAGEHALLLKVQQDEKQLSLLHPGTDVLWFGAASSQ